MFNKGLLLCLLLVLIAAPLRAQEGDAVPTLIPIGAGYPDTYPGFLEAALPNVTGDRFYILMIPASFSYDAAVLTAYDLLDNSLAIERRRRQLEDACDDIAPGAVECQVVVPPIWTRQAALEELALDYFTDDLAAVYFVGGDQTIAMQILADTPFEAALADAYARGVVMGGNSAGLAMLSRTMIGGYLGEFGPETGIDEGAVDLWNQTDGADGAPPRRGLSFGLENAILEQHFWERARISRLLNALALPDTPNVGIGVDSYSGAVIRDGTMLESVFGLYGAVILDAETTGAAQNARFVEGHLSIRDVIVHVHGTGAVDYDLATRQHADQPNISGTDARNWSLTPAPAAGALVLWSDLIAAYQAGVVSFDAANDAGELVVFTGFPDAAAIRADYYAGIQGVTVVDLDAGDTLPADLTPFGRITVHAADATLMDIDALMPLRDFWLAGGAVVLDNAAAAAAGQVYAFEPPIPYDSDDSAEIEAALQGAIIDGMVEFRPGLALIGANIEVRVMDDNRFARLFALEYENPIGTLGLSNLGAVSVAPEGVTALHEGVYGLSFGLAALSYGDNAGLTVWRGLLDVFAPGETLE